MKWGVYSVAFALTAAAFAGTAGSALALGKASKPPVTALNQPVEMQGLSDETVSLVNSLNNDSGTSGTYAKAPSKSYQVNLKGRWGLKVDVNQNTNRPSGLNDIDAGAYFKLSPNLKVGGAVGFGTKNSAMQPAVPAEPKAQPRVKVETTFNF